ncbi:peptidoglycan-binding protein [Aerosakkonemataceae cyanobacterium BLCC-F154]|uniref:Peptidoglycan-binding protein n=1 Tax=Floridaenema fluviatile BLCC-F154 TaxID=3153640 RepID=A0ABV4YLT1_9CYAN
MPARTIIRLGSKGSDVKYLQQLLNKKGYSLKVDGDFGPRTEAAVKQFQKSRRLTVDGIVGPATWNALLS